MEIIEKYIIEEIKYLRAENLHFSNIQNATIGIGLTFISAMVKIGIDNIGNIIFTIIFQYGIPIVCFITLLIWIGAVTRCIKAAIYVFYREKIIQARKDIIFWQNWLRQKDNGFTYIDYFAIIALFLGIELASMLYAMKNVDLKLHNIIISIIIFAISYFFKFFKGLKIIDTLV
jgi:hypothetical protein